MNIIKKIPTLEQVYPVYAVIVVMIYTRSLILFFWRLPSWLYFLTLGEISVIFSYMVVVTLLESLLTLLVPVLLAISLPKKWFCDRFMTMGSSLVLLGLGYLMFDYEGFIVGFLSPWALLQKVLVVGFVILGMAFLIDRIGFLNKIILEISNRLIVFLYIWVPISAFSLLIVLFRNIF